MTKEREASSRVTQKRCETTLLEVKTNPNNFIRRVSQRLERENPEFYQSLLEQALILNENGRNFLLGVTFGYEILVPQEKPALIPLTIIENRVEKVQQDAQDLKASKTPQEEYQISQNIISATQQETFNNLNGLKTENVFLYRAISELVMTATIEGLPNESSFFIIDGALVSYNSVQTSKLGQKLKTPEREKEIEEKIDGSLFLPTVTPQITSQAFLEIILDDTEFVACTMERLQVRSPKLEEYFLEINDLPYGYNFCLSASFIYYCLEEAFKKAGAEAPTVSTDTIGSSFFESIQLLQQGHVIEAAQNISEQETQALREIRKSDSQLYRGINLLYSRGLGDSRLAAFSALRGCSIAYRIFRAQAEADRLERMFNSHSSST